MQIFNILLMRVRYAFMTPIGLAIFSILGIGALIWFFGPLMGYDDWYPLATEDARIMAIAIITGLIILLLVLRLVLRWRKERRLAKELAGGDPEEEVDPSDVRSKEEVDELQKRMTQALQILRKSKLGGKGGGKSLYQLPWYIMIGPPGAGKTTAIVNSGLKFPLADKMGKNAIVGVGGTRNCDWWFTNDAVLIDTAGRYTTQESDAEADAKSWLGFLNILKKSRARQPINGAMVAISLSDLSLQDEQTRRTHALAIRTRLRELKETLGVTFPVYVLFTKADLMAGFSEFFERFVREEREQVWGFTFPLSKKKDGPPALDAFDEEFTALIERLNDRAVELLQQETDHRRRSLVYGFPSQVESLRGVAKDFLGEVFQESAYEDRQLLRGIYFTSGTQEGTPIDRLMRGMAQTFGIGRQAVGSGEGQGKSFFLTRLLEGVIFNEAGLVSADDKVERRYKWVVRGSIAASVSVLAIAATLWTISFMGNSQLISEARANIDQYRNATDKIQINPVADIDIASVNQPLNILRDMPGNPAFNEPDPPIELTMGLYQGDYIGTEAAQTYRSGLNQLLLPRLLLRLEKQMQSNFQQPELLFSALKVYLMLGQQGPMDRDLIKAWMNADWNLAYAGARNDQLRADLMIHLDQLLDDEMDELELNGALVEAVRDILTEVPLAERIYQGILESPEAKAVPDWSVRQAGGTASARVLIRPSGAPLTEGIDGIYTYLGFVTVFLNQALEVPDRLRRESWVLGERGAEEMNEQRLSELTNQVLNLYYDDYVQRWNAVLSDIDIVPSNSEADAKRIINLLSGASSPIKGILDSAAYEVELTREYVPEGFNAEDAAGEATDLITDRIIGGFDDTTRRLAATLSGGAVLDGGSNAAPVPEFGLYVEQRFDWLLSMTEKVGDGPDASSILDDIITGMREIYQEMNQTSGPLSQQIEGGAIERAKLTMQDVEAGPLERWSDQVVAIATNVTKDNVRANLNKLWQGQILPLCQKTLTNRYPFDRRASSDVALQDFARLFAPGGMIDSFFNEHLFDFVETTSKPWGWKSVHGAELGINQKVLTQFQHAADIRDAFFLGSGLPAVTFDLKPLALDPQATSVTLDVEGQAVEYAHGPQQVTPLKWPGNAGGRTRIALAPQGNSENSIQREGPWAWFRLLDAAEIRGSNASDRSKLIFNVGGRIAMFDMRAGSALNPFSLPALRSFRCPNSL